MTASRLCVFNALVKIEENKSYSNIVIDKILESSSLEKRDRAFASALFYGVISRKITLDHIISKYSSKSVAKTEIRALTVLRMGLYQLLYMDSVPDNAAVNESVDLAKAGGCKKAAGFINAVLRGFIRDGKSIDLPDGPENLVMSIKYSCPEWLVRKWIAEYGQIKTEGILQKSLEPPKLVIRVNTLKTTADELAKSLSEKNISVQADSVADDSLIICGSGEIDKTDEFKSGMFHVQDSVCQLAVSALDLQPGMTLLDLCAAPGGKSFTAAQYMQNSGKIVSRDLYDHKIKLIRDGASRLGIDIISAETGDASKPDESLPEFDRVLCDVPCSGLGIIRRKPEIKYKSPKDLAAYPEMSGKILNNAARHVKSGGILVFSTCTLNRNENDFAVKCFLSENNDFLPLPLSEKFDIFNCKGLNRVTVFPQDADCDGFFIARFIRK